MELPPLINLASESEYRAYYEETYCSSRIYTFDGIIVRFRKNDFDHCFYESSNRDGGKDMFSLKRAQRIGWIKEALSNSDAELYIGWNKQKKSYNAKRRVVVVFHDYITVIQLHQNISGDLVGKFITAYCADNPSTLKKIKRSPKWA